MYTEYITEYMTEFSTQDLYTKNFWDFQFLQDFLKHKVPG